MEKLLTWTRSNAKPLIAVLGVAICLSGGIAAAQYISSYTSSQNISLGATPSGTSAGTGLVPSGGYKVSVQAPLGCAFVDGGVLAAWTYSNGGNTWSREPALDIPVTIPIVGGNSVGATGTNTVGNPAPAMATLVTRGRSSLPQVGRLYYQMVSLNLVNPATFGLDAGAAFADGGLCITQDAGAGNIGTVVIDGIDGPGGPTSQYP